MKKKGISLITLAVTILVMAILTTVIIMTTNNSGIISNSKNTVSNTNLANVKELATVAWTNGQIDGIETTSELQTYVEEKLIQNGVDIDLYVIEATMEYVRVMLAVEPTAIIIENIKLNVDKTVEAKVTYLPEGARKKDITWSVTTGTDNITITEEGKITGVKEGDVTIKALIAGSDITATKAFTVGPKLIEYTAAELKDGTNFGKIVTGYNSSITDVEWKLFYADDSNIYLIASDYIPYTLFPEKIVNGISCKPIQASNNYAVNFGSDTYMTGIFPGYTGSNNITTEMRTLNNEYFNVKKYADDAEITNKNMKVTAYMLDSDIWTKKFKDIDGKAKYVIGGPTVELFYKSYNKKHSTSLSYTVPSSLGYYTTIGDFPILSTSDSLYVITDTTKSEGYWLASPSSNYTPEYVEVVDYYGSQYCYEINDVVVIGFRPIICLNSDVVLAQTNDGYKIQ